jgi:hypothetical protein
MINVNFIRKINKQIDGLTHDKLRELAFLNTGIVFLSTY